MSHDRSINSDHPSTRRAHPASDPLRPSTLAQELSLPVAGLAGLFGISPQAIYDRARSGVLKRTEEGRFPVVENTQLYIKELQEAAGRFGHGKKSEERARLTLAQAEFAELRVAKLKGELVPALEVERGWRDIFRQVRAGVLAAPSRIGARLGLPASEVEAIDRELRDVLENLAGGDSPLDEIPTDEKSR